jgi:hypothetical protein
MSDNVHVTEVGHWPAETWQPAIIKNYETIIAEAKKRPPSANPSRRAYLILKEIVGKRILVRIAVDPETLCSCGCATLEVEPESAKHASAAWGSDGRRPTITSCMVLMD